METQLETRLEDQLQRTVKHWYVPLIIGIILLATAIWTFTSPLESYLALAILFSISFLSAGLLETYFAIANREGMRNWGWNLAFGIITTIVGLLLLINPQVSMVSLPLYVGFVVLFRSIMAIGWATDLKRLGVLNWGNVMVIGVLGIIFSFILLWNPLFAGMTLVFWTALAFLASGIFSIYLSTRLRKMHKSAQS